ncbi:MAG: N-alpha-acetyl-L-2,4-diaminobutyrate deacetylase [bacterium]|jgi:N-alpha-acetyl-L-2,4-diaminobutyrate deacetylase
MSFASLTHQHDMIRHDSAHISYRLMSKTPSKIRAVDLDLDLSTPPESFEKQFPGAQQTHLTLDLTQFGKQHGHLVLPLSQSTVEDGHMMLPVCVIRGTKPGPTVTLVAGIHGDEFEGPITLQRMAKELTPDSIHGCLILIPCINLAGLRRSKRRSPLDGKDMDTCFPGKAAGSISERVAYEVFQRLIKPANLVLDMRSGGIKLNFAPLAAIRSADGQRVRDASTTDLAQQRQLTSEAAMTAFGAPHCLRMQGSAANSCLQGATDAAGIPYVHTELGGGAASTVETLAIAWVGCHNVLRQQGLLKGDVELRSSRTFEIRDNSFYVYATCDGILAQHLRLGADVHRGDPLASVVSMVNTGDQAYVLKVPKNATLLATRHAGPVKAGDLVAILADEVPQ